MKRKGIFVVLFFCFFSEFTQATKKHIPDKLVVLTFDDATVSHYSIVAPLLKKYNFGATFFVCEFSPNFGDSSKYMNWQQIKGLDRMGFEIANHTRTHDDVSKMSDNEFLAQIEYMERKCDSLGIITPESFAYPGYGLNLQTIKLLQKKHYCFARAGGSRVYDPMMDHPMLIPSWAMNSTNKIEIMNALKEAHDGKIVVLTIHGVPDLEHNWVSTPPEMLREYLQHLADNHYKVVGLRDLKKYITVKKMQRKIVPNLNKKLSN